MKLGLFSLPREITSYRQAVDFAKTCGIAAVEPYCDREFTLPDVDAAKRLADYAGEQGIGICCFSLAVNVAATDNTAEIERLKRYADVAAAMGSPFLHHTLLPGLKHDFVRLPFSQLLQRAVQSIRTIYDYAEQVGVKCVYEDQGYVFNGCERFERLIEAVDREIGVVADLGNILFVGEQPEVFVGRFAPFIDHVHVKDYLFQPGDSDQPDSHWLTTRDGDYLRDTIIGHGAINFEKIIRILLRAGYQGYYSLEYCGPEDAFKAIRTSADNLQRLYVRAGGTDTGSVDFRL